MPSLLVRLLAIEGAPAVVLEDVVVSAPILDPRHLGVPPLRHPGRPGELQTMMVMRGLVMATWTGWDAGAPRGEAGGGQGRAALGAGQLA